jgi:hypothetical protein
MLSFLQQQGSILSIERGAEPGKRALAGQVSA